MIKYPVESFCGIFLQNPMADTDGDGTPDIDELGGVAPTEVIDLDELITLSSRGAITGTNYGKILSYKYVSNPIRSDV